MTDDLVATALEAAGGFDPGYGSCQWEDLDYYLRLRRLGFAPVTCPTARNLEDLFYPDARRIAEAAYALVRGRAPSWPASGPLPPEIVGFRGPF